ncbi:hypothetical protein VFPPC_06965 [Pochonia chlamydosporia 170]|uniref:Uncharacterized protein n=1 Tax=Pochonia chlamydosporia 170 TaxID=1380566 RepID=A0A179FAH0_METCM|nr:hypothetical protein VFPPC_06965 [Pochonia chlamydosporia 170]OAQ62407.1 hypothetical protein VFPPC_06965 [Pochonia chlamydosporia 170]
MRFSIAVASTIFLAAVSAAPAGTDGVTVRRGDADDAALIADFNLQESEKNTVNARDDEEEDDEKEDDEIVGLGHKSNSIGARSPNNNEDDEIIGLGHKINSIAAPSPDNDKDDEKVGSEYGFGYGSGRKINSIDARSPSNDKDDEKDHKILGTTAAWSAQGEKDHEHHENDEEEVGLDDTIDMSSLSNSTEVDSTISPRFVIPIDHWNCNTGEWVDRRWIEAEVSKLKGQTWCAAVAKDGPTDNSCTHVGCTKGAHIYLCNNRGNFLKVRCYAVADVIERLMRECVKLDANYPSVRGQIFTKDKWGIYIKSAKC